MRNLIVFALSVSVGACSLLLDDGYTSGAAPPDDGASDASLPLEAEASVPCTADVQRDPLNCGACGRSCLGGTCAAGQCAATVLAKVDSPSCLGVDGAFAYIGGPSVLYYVPKNGGTLVSFGRGPAGGPLNGTPRFCTLSGENVFYGANAYVGRGPRGANFDYFAFEGVVNPDPAVRAVAVGGGQVYASFETGRIGTCPTSGCPNKDGATNQDLAILAAGEGDPAGLTATSTTLTWTNRTAGTVRQLVLGTGAAPTTVASGQEAPTEIVDSSGDLFWINQAGTIMKRSADNATMPKTLATGLDTPTSLVVDAQFVYWLNGVDAASVMRVARDGSTAPTILAPAEKPVAIAVDATYVYWITGGPSGELRRIPK